MKSLVVLCFALNVLGNVYINAQVCKPYSTFKRDCNTCLCSGSGMNYDCTEEICDSLQADDDLQFLNNDDSLENSDRYIPYGNDALPAEADGINRDELVWVDDKNGQKSDGSSNDEFNDDQPYIAGQPGEDMVLLPDEDNSALTKREARIDDDRIIIAEDPKTGDDVVLLRVDNNDLPKNDRRRGQDDMVFVDDRYAKNNDFPMEDVDSIKYDTEYF